MTLDELKAMAREDACDIMIEWEKVDSDKKYQRDMERTFKSVERSLVELETIFNQLSSQQSVLFEGKPSPLPYEEVERLLGLVSVELVAAYTVMDVAHRYRSVRALTT